MHPKQKEQSIDCKEKDDVQTIWTNICAVRKSFKSRTTRAESQIEKQIVCVVYLWFHFLSPATLALCVYVSLHDFFIRWPKKKPYTPRIEWIWMCWCINHTTIYIWIIPIGLGADQPAAMLLCWWLADNNVCFYHPVSHCDYFIHFVLCGSLKLDTRFFFFLPSCHANDSIPYVCQ